MSTARFASFVGELQNHTIHAWEDVEIVRRPS
jgi:hypothetical protein